MIVTNLPDLVISVKLQRPVPVTNEKTVLILILTNERRVLLVNRRPDVVTVVSIPHLLQLPHTGDIGKAHLTNQKTL